MSTPETARPHGPEFQPAVAQLATDFTTTIQQHANQILQQNATIDTFPLVIMMKGYFDPVSEEWHNIEEAREGVKNSAEMLRHWANADNIEGRQEPETAKDNDGRALAVVRWQGIVPSESASNILISCRETYPADQDYPSDYLGMRFQITLQRKQQLVVTKPRNIAETNRPKGWSLKMPRRLKF
ncbi:MAG TPA: hypothetical protein VLF90_04140 [Patescibacteria group bacterium]|nr:hypothetical protein [Patescibacteria group bacterium]